MQQNLSQLCSLVHAARGEGDCSYACPPCMPRNGLVEKARVRAMFRRKHKPCCGPRVQREARGVRHVSICWLPWKQWAALIRAQAPCGQGAGPSTRGLRCAATTTDARRCRY